MLHYYLPLPGGKVMAKRPSALSWGVGLLVVLVAGSAALVWAHAGPPQTDSLRTRRLEIIGKDGKVLAVLGVGADGNSGLFIMDRAGRRRAALIAGADGNPDLRLL